MRTAQFAILGLLLAAFGLGGCGKGSKPVNTRDGDNDRVELLGSRKVNFGGDHDTINVSMRDGTFHAIRIEVDGSDLEMWDVDVFFQNGGHEDFATRLHFEEGSWSRRIDLRGGARGIDKVTFKYKSKRRGSGRADIKLYGIH
jgi:hypothetical protein